MPFVVRRDDKERSATAVRAHRYGELDEHVGGSRPRFGAVEPEQRIEKGRTVGEVRRLLVDYFQPVAFEHRDVDVFAPILALMLHDQEARRRHLQDEAERRNPAGRSPDAERVAIVPDAEVDAGTLHRRSDADERHGRQRQRPIEQQRVDRCATWHIWRRRLTNIPWTSCTAISLRPAI